MIEMRSSFTPKLRSHLESKHKEAPDRRGNAGIAVTPCRDKVLQFCSHSIHLTICARKLMSLRLTACLTAHLSAGAANRTVMLQEWQGFQRIYQQ